MPAEAFVKRVQIRNYKSIGNCVVALGPLTILVGRNGSGKSNFLDALRFVADGLQTSLDHAVKTRGGVDAVRRRSTGHPRNFSISLEINLRDGKTAAYGFEIGSQPEGGFFVKQERLRIRNARNEITAEYRVVEARLEKSLPEKLPPASRDRLYLVNAAGLPEFRGVYDELSAMGFYNLNPEAIKELQSPDAGELLHRDGSNIASVIGRLSNDQPKALARIKSYLKTIIPGITDLHRVGLGPRETLEFRQEVVGSAHPWKFYAASMSDGTLRALGTLVAVTQLAERKRPVRLIGIEEPETALHPENTVPLAAKTEACAFRFQGTSVCTKKDGVFRWGFDRPFVSTTQQFHHKCWALWAPNGAVCLGRILRTDKMHPSLGAFFEMHT